jgi:hypothetical protein
VNGYSGYFPPHYGALRFGLMLRDPDVLTQLATHGITDVVVDREADPNGRWDAYVSSHPDARLVCTQGQQSLYRITSKPAPIVNGHPLQMAVIRSNVNQEAIASMIDQDRSTRWESGPQSVGTFVELDFGTVRTVSGIDMLLGPFVEDFPRGLVIEASDGGSVWKEIWQGSGAGLTFVGAVQAPLDVPMKYRFEPVAARLLRMRLTKNDDTYYWSIAELKVLGSDGGSGNH